jgi:hypothetical protein
LRGDVKFVTEALRRAKPEDISEQLAKGEIIVREAGKLFRLAPGEVKVLKETESAGRKVEVIDVPETALTILVTI